MSTQNTATPQHSGRPPRARVIVDNDFAGDPDDLFQLAHHLLSPAVEVPFIIASRLPAVPPGFQIGSVGRGASVVEALLNTMKLDVPIKRGTEQERSGTSPVRSSASDAIVAEALRDDTELPLYLVLGGGLTELANAYLTNPAIADRVTAIWIGGPGYSEIEPEQPAMFGAEYNMNIDVPSAQIIFNSSIPLWQVPADTYRQCLVSWAELRQRLGGSGQLGAHLIGALDEFADLVGAHGTNLGETYVLGDNPLVLLTALQSGFDPDPSSSNSVSRPRMSITDSGWYGPPNTGLPAVRVFTELDTRLMFEDMYAKFTAHAASDSDSTSETRSA